MSGMMCQPGTDHVHSMECSPNTMFDIGTWEMPCYHSGCTSRTPNWTVFQTEWCDIIPRCVCIYLVHLIILIRAYIQTESCQWFHRMWLHSSLVCFLLVVPCWGSNKMYLIITLVNCLSDVQKRLHLCLSLRWFARLFFIYIWLQVIIH